SDALQAPAYGASSTWDIIIGDPDNFIDPLDPHMIESVTMRSGTDPVTAGPGGTPATPQTKGGTGDKKGGQGDPAGCDDVINGHEWDVGPSNGDLRYACMFKLPTSRDCSPAGGNSANCDCSDDTTNGTMPTDASNPLCSTVTPTQQVAAKGYPGIR